MTNLWTFFFGLYKKKITMKSMLYNLFLSKIRELYIQFIHFLLKKNKKQYT